MPRHSPYALVRLNFPMLSSSLLNCLSFIKQIMIGCQFSVKRFDPFCFELFTPPFGEIVIYPNWKDLLIFANLLVKSLCPLICSFLTLQYFIRFSMNISANSRLSAYLTIAWCVRTRLVDLGCRHCRLVGSNSNHSPTYRVLICDAWSASV